MQGVRDMDSSLCYEGSHRSVCQRWGKRLRPVAWPRSAHRQSCSYQDVKEQQRAGHSQDSRWPSLITHLTHFLAIINTQPEQMALYWNKECVNVQREENQGETLLTERGLKSPLTDDAYTYRKMLSQSSHSVSCMSMEQIQSFKCWIKLLEYTPHSGQLFFFYTLHISQRASALWFKMI